MNESWPDRLRHFSLAVDFIEDDTFADITGALGRYFEEVMGCHYYRVLVDGAAFETDEGEILPALATTWTNDTGQATSVVPVRSTAKTKRLVVLSYVSRCPMWVVAKDGGPLRETIGKPSGAVDSWSDTTPLPEYRPAGEKATSTAVIHPLQYGERCFGVIKLESESHIPISERAKQNIKTVADALGQIIWIWKTTKTQLDGTRRAFAELEGSLDDSVISPIERRRVFVASSGRADAAVMQVIRDVLSEFGELFEVDYWNADTAGGNINEHIRSTILGSDFGVCYISEPAGDESSSDHAFFDNPNVLFEAGMLQMLHEVRDRREDPVSRWIPIREGLDISPPLPFDFAGDRVVTVPRPNGQLDSRMFSEMVRNQVKTTVDQLKID